VASGKAPAKKPEEQEEGSPAWMTTFGDMMTLLLTFFVLLVSMSVIREEEFEAARKSLREVFLYGYWKPTETPIESDKERLAGERTSPELGSKGPDVAEETAVQRIKQEIDSKLEQIGMGGLITSYLNVREVRIRIPDQILFGVDSAELKDLFAYEVLYGIAQVLKEMEYCINIEGHTADRDVVGGEFKDLWELSTARALTVLRYFAENDIDSMRLSAVGHGATRPVEDNSTFRGRALNRRVEIVVRDVTPKDLMEQSKPDRER
jgi:chemotaxis protein MotB